MAARAEIDGFLSQLLQPERFKDYGPNGLQVEGKGEVFKLVSGVTASLALIDRAIEWQADAVLVHHGLFWRGHDGRLTGWLKVRVERLMAAGINLWAYHLPLDDHADLGNNAQLGALLGWRADARFGEQRLGFLGDVPAAASGEPPSAEAVATQVRSALGRVPVLLPGDGRPVRRVAWCSGGAQGYFESAIAAGADLFLTGELSEPQAHLSRETGVAFLACGHHASERYGAAAVGEHLAAQWGLQHQFIDIDNPA